MRAIIIDDELRAINLLNELIHDRFPQVEIVALGQNAADGIRNIREYQPDVVFLDINMPGQTGFEMLQELQPASFDVVFITAYDQYAVRAFKYHAFDFLLKPVDPDELIACIDRLQEKKKGSELQSRLEALISQLKYPQTLPQRLTIHSLDGITIIPIVDIIYLEAAGTYTLFYTRTQEKLVSSINLKEYEEMLTPHHFFRVHNSFLINMKEVKKYISGEGGSAIMSSGAQVSVSRRRREEFLRILGAK